MMPRLALACFFLPALAVAHPEAGPGATRIAATPLPTAPLGQREWSFVVESGWAKLPPGIALGPTHGGVVVDRAGLVYVSSDGPAGILVFAPGGEFLRSIAPELSGIHGLMLRDEDGRQFIYAAHVKGHQVVKLALDGTVIWTLACPTESGLYPELKDYHPKVAGAKPATVVTASDGRTFVADGYMPTAVAVAPDGRIYVADGYGASVIHEYSAARKWLRVIGAKGSGDGEFQTCHGLTLDLRNGPPLLLVCDRENKRLVQLDLDGNFVRTLATGLRRPCAIALMGDYAAVAELEGRVVITDRAGKIVATLGDNPDRAQWAAFQLAPEFWRDGIFIAPHGLAFDAAGNLYVQDWNYRGRLTKLRRTVAGIALAR
jgi:sugar lactone lactonase YvrE